MRAFMDLVAGKGLNETMLTEGPSNFTGDVEGQGTVSVGDSAIAFDQRNGIGQVPDNTNVGYMGFAVLMTPGQFASLAATRDFSRASNVEYLEAEMRKGTPIGSPWLSVDFTGETAKVISHEGRTRMEAIRRIHGDDMLALVHIFAARGDRARHLSDEQIREFRFYAIPEKTSVGKRGPFFLPTVNHLGQWKTPSVTKGSSN